NRYTEKMAVRDASPDSFTQVQAGILERDDEKDGGIVYTGSSSSTAATSSSRTPPPPHTERSHPHPQTSDVEALRHDASSLDRVHTSKSQHSQTVGGGDRGGLGLFRSKSSRSRPLPAFGAGKPYPPPLGNQEDYVVDFDGEDDPLHAQNWMLGKKLFTALMLGFTTVTASFASSIFSTATRAIELQFNVGYVVATLGTSLYILGFATGPVLWAPFSELKGRRLPLIIASFGFSVFNIACATAKDLQTILICRFFAGFFGACPITIVAAVFADMFANRTRGIAICLFSVMVFTGPFLAPFIGGFIVMSNSWRWTQYLVSFMGFASFTLMLLFLDESYPPIILVAKAAELRRRTKNWGIHAKQEEIEVDFRELIEKNFSRPLRMLVTERIVLLLSIYIAFIYGLLYLFLTAYPIVFQGVHGMNPGVGGLPFFGMIIGELFAGVFIFARQPGYQKKLAANNNVPVPEWRLPEVIVGGVAFAGGLFWFGWTGYRADIHWIVPTCSGLLIGFGIMSIFLQSFNYIIDAYLMFAASAIAANTFLRSIWGAAFPLFAKEMFEGMGVEWASTLLGCFAAAMIPVPVWFYLQGAKIREKSAYAPTSKPASPPSEE
ncbi:major facilitator superfamily, partial [Alternaria rosae]|uniref:major facilitator superfamily n=1 Tax=Alternaria rosae TaxID=1187941 RepID=UPI001E8DC366